MRPRPSLLAALAALLLLPAAALADVPEGAEWSEAYIETPGEPTLHVDVLKPAGTPEGARLPVIVVVGPYGAHAGSTTPENPLNQGPNDRWDDLYGEGRVFERGYAVAIVDSRGFGASEGCNDFGGTGEQTDARRAVEWAASQPWSTGRVGMWGKSYDAWTQVMALDEKPAGLAATIIQAPIIDGYRTLYQNGVHYDYGWYATPALYQSIDLIPPTVFDSPEYFQHAALGTDPACYALNITLQNSLMDHDDPLGFWAERDLPGARGSDVPTLWSHGFMDANTKPDNFLPVWSTLTGPKRAWFGQFAHDRGNEAEKVGRTGFFDQAFEWLDRHVKGDTSIDTGARPQVEVAEADGRWRGEAQWPPLDAVARTMAIAAGSFTDAPSPIFGAGSDAWSLTEPLLHEARLSGPPVVRLKASTPAPRGNLVAQLWAIDPEGVATLVTRGAHVVEGDAGELRFELYPQDWTLAAGTRLGLRLTTDDLDWYTPPHSLQTVTVSEGQVDLPFLTYQRDGFLGQAETPAMRGRQKLSDVTGETVAFEQPPALVPRPPAAPQGGVRAPKGSGAPANRLRVVLRRNDRGLFVRVTGALESRVRMTVLRGRRAVARRTVRSRGDRARTSFRITRPGRYRVKARTLGGVRLTGASRRVRVR